MQIAFLLQRAGIPFVLLERSSPDLLGHRPKAGLIEYRTVELLRREGIADAILAFDSPLPPLEPNAPHDPKGSTLLDAVMTGVGDALRADPRVFVIGEDVGGAYGNAFLLLRPLLKEFGPRILNSPLAEGAVIGACISFA